MSGSGLVDNTDNAISNFEFDHAPKQTPSRFNGNQVKQLVLLLLVVQNVATILSMKQASGIRATDGRQALTTSIVVMVEILKVAFCITEIIVRRRGIHGLMTEISEDILSRQGETAMMMVPCFLYFVQNNLLLVAVASLDPPVYYVVSQVKNKLQSFKL